MRYMKNTLLTVGSLLFLGNGLIFGAMPTMPESHLLASRNMSLENRAMPGSFMNSVMKDNILLTIGYMRGIVNNPSKIDWNEIRKPFTYTFELKSGESYAFQKDSLPEYADSVVKTINVNFGGSDGYKHDGYLMGDGVCHLASLFYWAAKDAGIQTTAPTNHDFMAIPEVPREYGVSIYSTPGEARANAQQNLYIKNDTKDPILFEITYDGKKLETKVLEKEDVKTDPALITQATI